MTSLAIEFGEFDLPQRNALATKAIEKYAARHATADAAIGLAGFLPIPGAGPASIGAALLAQIPIYKSLAGELALIYEAPHDNIVRGIVNTGMAIDSIVAVSAELASEFGMAFAQEIGGEVLREIGVGVALSAIPILGGLVSMGLDVMIAVTMTWRVGTMVSIYYQNGRKWVESRRDTYEIAKELTGGLSKKNGGRVDLNSVPWRVKAVGEAQIRQWVRFVSDLIAVAPSLTDELILDVLAKKGIDAQHAQEVLRRVRDDRGPSPEAN